MQNLNYPLLRRFFALFIVLMLLTTGLYAQQADTISADGLDFTAIEATVDTPQSQPVAKAGANNIAAQPPAPVQPSLWSIFLAGIVGGVAAFFMPCIFPMLPMTIAFFTKTAGQKNSAVGKALIYGISIIVIYVVLGLLITIIFGSDALNSLSTNGIFNFLFFLLLLAFAASFLGAFEIVLPSGWVNTLDAKSDKKGLLGLFFMAATLAIVSFSCTGPIIGTLLVQTATSGALLAPAVGMLGYSLALALPFAFFAMFPHWISKLPKSGGWLNSIKVVLGFLELALSLKFLSNVDLAYHWHWFDREVMLVLWIVIAALTGFYLLGKLRFSHDSVLPYISVPRLFMAIAIFAFTLYMVPGLWGAPLKAISAILPPQETQDFDLYTPTFAASGNNNKSNPPTEGAVKYANLFTAPLHLKAFFDYDEGIAYAKQVNKPVMIDFTGHACVNCRKMEASVWPDKEVYQRINNDYVLIQLYVDDKTELAPEEQTVTEQGKRIKTIGNKWSNLQAEKFASNSQPFYVLLNPYTQKSLVPPQGAEYDAKLYLDFLNSGIDAFNNK